MRLLTQHPEVAVFALVFGAYAYFYQAGGWNQNVRFDLTRAIVEDHTFTIDRFADNTRDLAEKDGHAYCDKAPGLSLMGALPYAVVYSALGSSHPSLAYLTWASWLSILLSVSLTSALGVVAIAIVLSAFGVSAGPRCLLAVSWGLATLAFPYSTLYYAHQPAAAFLMMSFAILIRIRRGIDPPSRARLVAVGALGGWAIVCEYPAAIAAVVIGVYALRSVKARAIPLIVAGGLVPAAVLIWYDWAAFGAPWRLAYQFSNQGNRSQGFFMGIGLPHLHALWGILGSQYRGLFYSAPWLLFAIPGAVLLWQRGFRDEAIACALIAALFVWMNASLVDWFNGWAVGPRYLVPCIPFLVVLAGGLFVSAPMLAHQRMIGVAVALAAGYSAFLMLAATAVQPEVDQRNHSPFREFVLPRFTRGELAISDQSIDMPFREKRGKRYAWNLGEQVGLTGWASLTPLLVWCAGWSLLLGKTIASHGHVRAQRPDSHTNQ